MLNDILILFCIALAAGVLAFFIPRFDSSNYKLVLVFAGAYLFSITIIHILPELFHEGTNPSLLGICVLGGFFAQQVLEFLSSGVEHGHIHVHHGTHSHKETSAFMVLLALVIHSFMEGGMLAHPLAAGHHGNSNTLLWGILLHKAPEAFALMSVLLCDLKSKTKAFIFLIIFCAASPLGLFVSNFLLHHELMPTHIFTFLFAVVSGNFLHISTTIVFESSLDHKFNGKKTGIAIAAAIMAVLAEVI